MKKIDLLVFKAFIRPFFVTFFIVMFVLLMLFLFKYIDDLIGKGFEWYVILELLWYASATNVAMALPLAMLLSSIMTFGSLGENYELVAIKSAGISLQRAMMSLVVVVVLFCIGAFIFSEYMLPVANLKMGSLLWDVRNQKAAFLLEDGVFNSSIPGYAIRVQKRRENGDLDNVVIYDHSTTSGNVNVMLAKQGKMYTSSDDQYLILRLKDGVRYEETASSGQGPYNPREQFTRYRFNETEQRFDLSGFKMQRTDESLFKSHYQMLNLKQLKHFSDSLQNQADSNLNSIVKTIYPLYKLFSLPVYLAADTTHRPIKPKAYSKTLLQLIPASQKTFAVTNAINSISPVTQELSTKTMMNDDFQSNLRRYLIEYQRKFTLSVSCLILFSIGAPLGAIIRKGGLGLPVVISILFFLTYHIISTIGEKYAKEGAMTPVWGMWIAIIILAPVGVFLTYKATVDSALFDIDQYKQLVLKLFKRDKKK